MNTSREHNLSVLHVQLKTCGTISQNVSQHTTTTISQIYISDQKNVHAKSIFSIPLLCKPA